MVIGLNPTEVKNLPRAPAYDVVAIGASAGGLEALMILLAALPSTFRATLLVVQHLNPRYRSLTAEILRRQTARSVVQARHGEHLEAGLTYVAPPNRHMLVSPGNLILLSASKPVNYVRPSADRLLESVASVYTNRAIAVILTGTGHDGAHGALAIHQAGGIVIAQDEATSRMFGMPRAAIELGCVDYILPLPEIASALTRLIEGVLPA